MTKSVKGITRVHNLKTGSTYRLRVRSTKKGEGGSILGKWKPPNAKKVRCGLCDVELYSIDWQEHCASEQHQSHFVKRKPFKAPVYPVREVSDEERKKNKREGNVAHAEFLGYFSVANGKSYDRMLCECGEVSAVFRWRSCKRCPNCWKLLHDKLSYSEKDLSLYKKDDLHDEPT